VRASRIAMGASAGAMAMGGPRLYCAWRTGKAMGKLKPAVAQGHRQGRVMRDAGGGGARRGNEEGASSATNAGYMETGRKVPQHGKTPEGVTLARERSSHTCRYGPPVVAEHCSSIASIHLGGQADDPTAKKKSGDMARGIVNNFFRLSLYRNSCPADSWKDILCRSPGCDSRRPNSPHLYGASLEDHQLKARTTARRTCLYCIEW
jgi:hypothetical protein